MKALQLILFLLIANHSFSLDFPEDSTRTGRFRHFNLAFNWFELGGGYTLTSKAFANLPEEASTYLNTNRKGAHYAFFGFTVYYKNTFGVGLMYSYNDFSSKDRNYTDYLAAKYPNHFTPKSEINYRYELEMLFLNLSYRKHFKHFFVEPVLRVGFNSYHAYAGLPRIKEIGSNQYIQLEASEKIKGPKNSYQLLGNIAHRFGEIDGFGVSAEAGVQASFMVAPIRSEFTFSETPYGGATTSNTYQANRWNPALGWSVFLNLYF